MSDGQAMPPDRVPSDPAPAPAPAPASPRLIGALVAAVAVVFALSGWLYLKNHSSPSTPSPRPVVTSPPTPTSTSTIPTQIEVTVSQHVEAIPDGSCAGGIRPLDTTITFVIAPAVVIPAFAGKKASVEISGGTVWDGAHAGTVHRDGTIAIVLKGTCTDPAFNGTVGTPTIAGAPIAGVHPVG
jgi:hypothetical protein